MSQGRQDEEQQKFLRFWLPELPRISGIGSPRRKRIKGSQLDDGNTESCHCFSFWLNITGIYGNLKICLRINPKYSRIEK